MAPCHTPDTFHTHHLRRGTWRLGLRMGSRWPSWLSKALTTRRCATAAEREWN